MNKFNFIFFGIILSTFMVMAGAYFHTKRPSVPNAVSPLEQVRYIKASGKCIECHSRETSSIVHQFSMSKHAEVGLNCLDCHSPQENQKTIEHKGFEITKQVTSKNCASCHSTEYEQFERSRHGAPAWAAVYGEEGFSEKQISHAEKYHPGTIKRPRNALAFLENEGTISKGCLGCHSIGKPNQDGSIGSCTECHSKHNPSVAMARHPTSCAQCHMGPDHSQFEIYSESKHGAYFAAHKNKLNLDADPKNLKTRDFIVPTCATCHMSGLEGLKVTHDTTERLSWFLFSSVSEKRPNFDMGRTQMKEVCMKCHAKSKVEEFYRLGDVVVDKTNETIKEAEEILADLRKKGLVDSAPFNEEIEFLVFDIWHYYGRTAKHGAFMGGADFVQWHGNYELLRKMVKLRKMAKELKSK